MYIYCSIVDFDGKDNYATANSNTTDGEWNCEWIVNLMPRLAQWNQENIAANNIARKFAYISDDMVSKAEIENKGRINPIVNKLQIIYSTIMQ